MIDTANNPDFLNAFLQYIATILNKSENTVKEYNYDLNHFLKFIMHHFGLSNEENIKDINIKNMSIDTIKKIQLDDIHAFLFYLTNTYHSKSATRARKVASIRVFFKYLTNKERILDKDPTIGLETPKQEKRLPKYLSLENSQKLLETTKNEIGEFKERINIKNIDFSENKMTVIGKGNKERTIYLNKACINAINEYLKVRPHEGVKSDDRDALFLSKRKERISNRMVQEIVKRELAKSGLDINKYSTHKLRHTAATLMYQYGNVDIRALQVLLGHQNISTTQIYTHVENEQVRNAVESNPLANM